MKWMSQLTALLIAAFLLHGCREFADPEILAFPQEGEFSVLTYNVAGLPEGISGSHPSLYSAQIGRLINDYDVVNVQEDFNYHHLLSPPAKHPYRTEWEGPVPVGDGLNTFSTFPIYDLKRFPWMDCTSFDCLTPKGFSYSRIEIVKDRFVDLYNFHCNAGGSDESSQARRNNIKQLTDYIAEHSDGQAVILMGDSNNKYPRVGDDIRRMFTLSFKDVWVELVRGGVVPEQDGILLEDCADASAPECETIDKVFYRSSEQIEISPILYKVEREIFQLPDGTPLSDHDPTNVKFKFLIRG